MVRERPVFRRIMTREIARAPGRFISIFLIVLLGVGFFCGMRITDRDMKLTCDEYLDRYHTEDIRVTSIVGLTRADLERIAALPSVERVAGGYQFDAIATEVDGDARENATDTAGARDEALPGTTNKSGTAMPRAPSPAEVTVATAKGSAAATPDMQNAAPSHTEGTVGSASTSNAPATATPPAGESLTAISRDSGSPVVVLSLSDEPGEAGIDAPRLVEGRLPRRSGECLAEPGVANRKPAQIGDHIRLSTPYGTKEFLVTGIAQSPLFISYERGTNSLGSGTTLAYLFVTEDDAFALALPRITWPTGFKPGLDAGRFYTEARITLKNTAALNTFGPEYGRHVDAARSEIQTLGTKSLGSDRYWTVSDRLQNRGIQGFQDDAERIGNLAKVFPSIFFLVAALVSLTAMTRLVEEKRGEVGTLMALGKTPAAIMGQYLWYAAAATFGGGIAGAAIGFPILPKLIYSMYRLMYYIGPLRVHYDISISTQAIMFAFLCTGGATAVAIQRELRSVPATLMRPRAPKPGKRILLERVPLIWNRLGFLRRITARNLFRYKSRLWMSIAGLAGCFGLLLTGFGMNDSLAALTERQFGEIYHYDALVLFSSTNLAQSRTTLDSIQATPGVDSAALLSIEGGTMRRAASKGHPGASPKQLEGYLVVFAESDGIGPFITLRDGKRPLALTDDGLILTRKAATLLGIHAGDAIELGINGRSAVFTVSGITDQYVMHFAYLSPVAYEKAFKKVPVYNEAALIEARGTAAGARESNNRLGTDIRTNTRDPRQSSETELAGRLLEIPGVARVSLISADTKLWEDTMKNMRAIIAVIIIAAGLLTFIVIYTLTSINIVERTKELATIKVLGFREKEVAQYIYRENAILSCIGAAIGLVFGIFLHHEVVLTTEVDVCMFGRQISMASYAVTFLLFSAFSFLANMSMAGRIRRIDMVEAMKSVE